MKTLETILFNLVMNRPRALIAIAFWAILWGVSSDLKWTSFNDVTWWGWILLGPGLALLALAGVSFFVALISLIINQFK